MAAGKVKYILIGLLAIVIIYSLYYLCLVYVSYYDAIPRKVRHLSRLVTILLVYGSGWYAFKNYGVHWMSPVWNFIYFAVVAVLILIGLYDWALGPAPAQIRGLAGTLHEFLISPILFVDLLIINRMMAKVTDKP